MRIRATVAAVSGALALSALAVPASQAAQSHDDLPAITSFGFPAQDRAAAPKAKGLAASKAAALPVISKVVVNGGKPIVVGTTATKKVSIAITASHKSGIADAATFLWFSKDAATDMYYGFDQNEDAATCKAASATTSTCTLSVTVDPWYLTNATATYWKAAAFVLSNDFEIAEKYTAAQIRMQRLSKLDVNAAPEPVKKGKTITVTGKLSRANWETGTYKGYATQSVKLQFRKKNSSTYTTVKTVKGSSTGTLKTTVKAVEDGYWRWSFAGTASTPAVSATGDFVDVK
ncbi:hypothetical protein CU044_0816 [Streptomyces sp. L-9-10]|uniref:DUF5707 domain-containing protein n=1 Tax=Streptomyces sp. L-9-10 TaxID=1478131 RepID=UPI00101D7B59|nr:DUF5707 domain-containing protein [Streptomyces sp. L-9-10]RYJ30766.1 hypothetical protein CU044_0816 [Streptomyces sp. L-9-10]